MGRAVVYKGDSQKYELVTDWPAPERAEPGHVVVRITLRPVNIMDLYFAPFVCQQLGKPIVPGYEGFGLVHSVGEGVTKLKEGQRVVPFLLRHGEQGNGAWQEYVSVAEDYVWPVPDSVSDESAAQFVVNPWTAFGMVDDLNIPKGEYLLQTAAASILGRYIVQLAKHYFGIKTINIVRRQEQVAELKALGADEVICSNGADFVSEVKRITSQSGAYAALDPVGGEATKPVCASVRSGGTVFLYGGLGGTFDASVGMVDLIRGVKLTGWGLLCEWDERRARYAREIGKLAEAGVLTLGGRTAAAIVTLDQVDEALRTANGQHPAGSGKVLLSSP